MTQLNYKNPEKVLAGLRWLHENTPDEFPEKVRMLRTREMRQLLELRQAALFCYGLSSVLHTMVSFALHESADYDALASFERDGKRLFVPIQLKEVVPEGVNPNANFQDELDKLKKYTDSKDLIVIFHLNKRGVFNINSLSPPKGVVAEIWVVAAINEAMTEWMLVGSILGEECYTYKFTYPEAQHPYELMSNI